MRGAALAALGALVAILAPSAALAQYMGNIGDAGLQDPSPRHLLRPEPDAGWPAVPVPGGAAPAGNAPLTALDAALDAAKSVIRAHAGGDYVAPDYPLVGAHIDEENGRLVVVLHEMARLAGIAYGEREIQDALGTGVGIEITHDAFYPGFQDPRGPRGSLLTQDTRYYLDNCLPVPLPGYRAVCVAYAAYLGERGTVSMPPHVPSWHYATPNRAEVLFFEDFGSALHPNWIREGVRGWDIGHPNDGPGSADRPASNLVAEAGPCEDECAITMRIPVDLPDRSSPRLEFWSYVDSSLRHGEYMRVQLHSEGKWSTIHERGTGNADNDRWNTASFDLSHVAGGEIRLRFVARVAGPAGSVAVDDVSIRARGPSLGDHLPASGDLPLEKFRPDVLTGGELRRLAGDLAAMHQMAMESGALRSRLPPGIHAPGGAAPYPDIALSDGPVPGLRPEWARDGEQGGRAPGAGIREGMPRWAHDPLDTGDGCGGVCSSTARVPADLSGYSSWSLEFLGYAESLQPGEYLKASVSASGQWHAAYVREAGDGTDGWERVAYEVLAMDGGDGHVGFVDGQRQLERRVEPGQEWGETLVKFETNVAGPAGLVAVEGVTVRGIEGVALGDYVPFRGALVPEALGPAELRRIAGDLASLYRIAMKSDAMRSHLPQGMQEAMGLEPFEYKYAECYLRDCPDEWPVSQGWDHESYLRSGGMDLTALCRTKHDSLLGRIAWADTGTYWDEFLHLCGKWRDADRVVEEFARLLEDGLDESCSAQVASGWRLGASGWLYPPGQETASLEPGRLADECLPGGSGLGEFLNDWRRMGL